MLRLAGKIGDQFVVTFVNARRGLQTQERINRRRVFPDRAGLVPRPGDKCNVTVIGENPAKTVYFVCIDSIIEEGSGDFSALEKALHRIKRHDRPADYDAQQGLIQKVHFRFRQDLEGLLEFLLDMMEAPTLGTKHSDVQLNYLAFTQKIEWAVWTLCYDNPVRAVEYFLRAAEHCSFRKRGIDNSRHLLERALFLCEHGAEELLERTLEAIDANNGECADFQLKKRILEMKEKNGLHCIARLDLASLMVKAGNIELAQEAIALLEPTVEALRRTDHFWDVSLHMGEAYFLLQEFELARLWLRNAAHCSADARQLLDDPNCRLVDDEALGETLLTSMRRVIEESTQADSSSTVKALAMAASHFGENEADSIELLLEFLTFFDDPDSHFFHLDRALLCSRVEQLIDSLANSRIAVDAYMRMGRSCAAHPSTQALAESMYNKGLDIAQMWRPTELQALMVASGKSPSAQ